MRAHSECKNTDRVSRVDPPGCSLGPSASRSKFFRNASPPSTSTRVRQKTVDKFVHLVWVQAHMLNLKYYKKIQCLDEKTQNSSGLGELVDMFSHASCKNCWSWSKKRYFPYMWGRTTKLDNTFHYPHNKHKDTSYG